MDVNNKTLISTAAAAAMIVVPVTIDYLRVRRVERAKRVQIELNLQKDLLAIRIASAKLQENIERGEYRDKVGFGITELMSDFEFYKMTARSEQD